MPQRAANRTQKRAMFFVFDGGTGLGHLRRLAAIAKALQGDFACLIVTGHREAAHWFVPLECEYVHLPAWDSLLDDKASYWGRQPFLAVDRQAAVRLRRDLIRGVVEAFRPDAIFVDHLPLGMLDELEDVITRYDCLKYLVTRGVQNETEPLDRLLTGGTALASIERHYHRVLVAIDPQVFDVVDRYDAFRPLRAKFAYTGYVVDPVDRAAAAACRADRGLGDDDPWVVASAGGGQHGEALIDACCRLAAARRDVTFDVVIGPRSALMPGAAGDALPAGGNLRLHPTAANLPQLHAGADIVVTSGGYNSLLEALQGHAGIVCIPSRKSQRDEQYAHAARLSAFAAIELGTDPAQLGDMLDRALRRHRGDGRADRRGELDFGGAATIRAIARADAGLPDEG